MICAPLPVRGGCEEVEALGFGSLHFECNRGRAGESRPRAFLLSRRKPLPKGTSDLRAAQSGLIRGADRGVAHHEGCKVRFGNRNSGLLSPAQVCLGGRGGCPVLR